MGTNLAPLTDSFLANEFAVKGPSVRCVAIYGAQRSGKTCYYASLYGHPSEGDVVGNFDIDGPTERYMRERWDEYFVGPRVPGATGKGPPERLRFLLTHKNTGRIWTMEALDHAGELIHRVPQDDGEFAWLRDLVRGWLQDCEAVLVFLDTSLVGAEVLRERRYEVGQLLQVLHLYAEEGKSKRVERPLGLVLTKWDVRGPLSLDPKVERDRARDFLKSSPNFRQVYEQLESFGERVEVFPVSAFGPGAKDGKPPPEGPEPYHLLAPLQWAAEQADEMRLQRTEREVAKRPHHLKQAIALYEHLVGPQGITCGPVHDKAMARLTELRQRCSRRWRRRVAILVAGLLLVAGTIGGVWMNQAGRAFGNLQAFRSEHPEPELAARRREMGQALLTWHSWALGGDRIAEVQRGLDADTQAELAHHEGAAWAGLLKQKETALTSAQIQSLLEALGKFKEEFRDGHSKEREELIAFANSRLHMARAFEAAVAEAGKLVDPEDLLRLWADYKASLPMPAPDYLAKADEQLASAKHQKDDEEWGKIAKFANESPAEYHEIIKRARRYNEHGVWHVDDAKKLIELKLAAWDRVQYKELRTAALAKFSGPNAVELLRKAATLADLYLDSASGQNLKRMAPRARAWRDWYHGLARKKVHVKLTYVGIPEGGELGAPEYSVRVTVSMAGRTVTMPTGSEYYHYKENPVEGSPDDYGEFDCTLGEGTLTITVKNHRGVFSYPEVSGIFQGGGYFLPAVLNSEVPIKDKKDKYIRLRFVCPEAEAPRLEEYPER